MGTEMELELESRSRPFFTAPAPQHCLSCATFLPPLFHQFLACKLLCSILFPAVARNAEVYVYNLPEHCFEHELLPFFDAVGPVYLLRLPIRFSGCIR